MLIKIIFSYIVGYLKIKVDGYYIERFINICKNSKIAMWNFKRNEDITISFNCRVGEFKKICKIAKKTKCKIKILSKRGVPFYLNKHKKRKIFFLMLICIISVTIVLSNFIWNIDVVVENGLETEIFYDDLKKAGLEIGKPKNIINVKDVINQLRMERHDIAWVGIEMKGTNAIVKIVKSSPKPTIIDETEYCNIISDKIGIISKINVQTGTANVKVGDIVKKGEILVNGWMEGKYTGVRYVHSKGNIEAKVWHTKNVKINYDNIERIKTGKEEKKYEIKFNNFTINLSKRLSKFKIYDTIETSNKVKLFSNFYLPILVLKKTNQEVEEVKKTYSIEEAKSIAIEEAKQILDKEIENKEKIVNENINVYENEIGVDVYVTYEVIENIGIQEKIVF